MLLVGSKKGLTEQETSATRKWAMSEREKVAKVDVEDRVGRLSDSGYLRSVGSEWAFGGRL